VCQWSKDLSNLHLAISEFLLTTVSIILLIRIVNSKIAQNVNADEAAVLGAAFYGASMSRQFKTKEIRVQDHLYGGIDVTVSYTADSKSGGEMHSVSDGITTLMINFLQAREISTP
jgi:hypoxia up-regulated 1